MNTLNQFMKVKNMSVVSASQYSPVHQVEQHTLDPFIMKIDFNAKCVRKYTMTKETSIDTLKVFIYL